jgi:hypothetical protein
MKGNHGRKMKTFFEQTRHVTRRLLLNALGAIAVIATDGHGVVRAAAPRRKDTRAQELCIECLAKRARQRSAFINKWV